MTSNVGGIDRIVRIAIGVVLIGLTPVSYTHLTLPTNREV